MTNELQKVEDELDAAESRLADITLQLEQAEATADENERYCRTLWPKIPRMTTLLQQVLQTELLKGISKSLPLDFCIYVIADC